MCGAVSRVAQLRLNSRFCFRKCIEGMVGGGWTLWREQRRRVCLGHLLRRELEAAASGRGGGGCYARVGWVDVGAKAAAVLTTYCLLLITHCLLLTTLYSLFATRYSLLTSHYLLLTTYHSLLTTHYPLSTTHCSSLTTHSSLLTNHNSLLTTHHPLLTTNFSLLTPHYLLLGRCGTPSSMIPARASAIW